MPSSTGLSSSVEKKNKKEAPSFIMAHKKNSLQISICKLFYKKKLPDPFIGVGQFLGIYCLVNLKTT